MAQSLFAVAFICGRMFGITSGWGWVTVNLGWCAGRNPPSVQRWHSAKRATRVFCSGFIDAYLPFHLAGRSFHRSCPAFSAINIASSSRAKQTFRFCSVASALALRLCRRCKPALWAEFPQTLYRVRKPPASSPTQHIIIKIARDKNSGKLDRSSTLIRENAT